MVFNNRYNKLNNIIKETINKDLFDILYCLELNNNTICLGLILKKEYNNISSKTKRYLQINILNDKIELYDGHNKDYRKNFYDEYKEQLEYLCHYIKDSKCYEIIKYKTNDKKISINSNIIIFELNINNELELNCLFRNVENNNICDCLNIICKNTKLLKKIKKGSIKTEDLLKNIAIKEEEIPSKVLEEIKVLNQKKVKKKIKNLPKKQ